MKKILVVLSLGLSVILGVMFLTPAFNVARAGFEPSPFQPEINQLNAVANILHSADFRVAQSIAHPPDPCVPPDPCNSPDLNGAVNRLEAINNQVSSADDMVKAMIEEVMGFEPTPFREDLIPAFQVVRDAADGITLRIGDFSPDIPPPTEYVDALGAVGNTAFDIVVTAQWGIDEFEKHCPCFADAQWSRIWDEWPADGVSVQCAEFPSTYSFELGHWVFGDDKAREFIAVLDIAGSGNTACRAQYGDPFASHDVPITAEQVEFCAEIMRAKADAEGVTCN